MAALRQAYGNMALTESALVLWTVVEPRSCRLFLVDFLVRMWRLNACERLMPPPARTRKRFLAPLLVFIFGMTSFLLICCPPRCSPGERLSGFRLYRLRACAVDAWLLPLLSSGPAASPFAGPRAVETAPRCYAAPGRLGYARATGCRIPDAPSRIRESAASLWLCRLRPGIESDS